MLTLFVSLALQLWLLEEQSAKSEQALLDEALPLRMMVVFVLITCVAAKDTKM